MIGVYIISSSRMVALEVILCKGTSLTQKNPDFSLKVQQYTSTNY